MNISLFILSPINIIIASDEGDDIFVMSKDKTSQLAKKLIEEKIPGFSSKETGLLLAVVETVTKVAVITYFSSS
jgi:hypothetical protein